jgi:Ca2+-binding RTX toxin-like protein
VKLRGLSTFTLSIFSSILLLSILNGSTVFLNNTWGDDITGTVDNDPRRGTINFDILIGLAGNDKLYGSSGADQLEGGEGADYFDCGKGIESFGLQFTTRGH